jgi:mannose-6-phosphate isomerase
MSELYPLLMAPHFDRRPWGARDLAPIYDRHVDPGEEAIGEVWLTWDHCRVSNGPWSGTELIELCHRFGRELVGAATPDCGRFPLLAKFLFPHDKLSVQVHPDDETAHRFGLPCGKTECWYIVQAEPDARVAVGLLPGTTRQEFERSIQEHRAEALLNWITPAAGDMIYVEAGTVHTLGPGSIIVETQQNSDTTFRLYDYGRPRETHVAEGLQALKEVTSAGKVARTNVGGVERLICASEFIVDRFVLDHELEFDGGDGSTAQVLVAIGGCGVVEASGCSALTFAPGDAVIIPATLARYRIRPQWQVEFLRAQLP